MGAEPVICPSILSCDPARFDEPVRQMMEGGAGWIHLDVMDGQFVPPITFGADLAASLKKQGNLPLEAHLMTLTPERHFDAFISAGCTRIIFHAETVNHLHRHCQELRERGIQAGVALNPGTPIDAVLEVSELCDLALIMTVNPGWGGQKLIQSCIEKVRRLREARPDMAIQVDGGVDPDTIRPIWEAGATDFVAGSYLLRAPSIVEGIHRLKEACA